MGIGSYKIEHDGRAAVLKLGTGAMMRIEEAADAPLVQVIEQFQAAGDAPRVSQLVSFVRELLDDGRGVSTDEAVEIFDHFGFETMMDAFQRSVEVAFPEASKGRPKGKPPGK